MRAPRARAQRGHARGRTEARARAQRGQGEGAARPGRGAGNFGVLVRPLRTKTPKFAAVKAPRHPLGAHSREVAKLALAVAEELRLDAPTTRNAEFAAMLHDIGKIRISKKILNKVGALDPAEWEVMRRHTIEAERMLRQIGGLLEGWDASSARRTSATTAGATPTGSPGKRSRSRPGSGASKTPTAR